MESDEVNWFPAAWKWLTTTRYVAQLESDLALEREANARLRGEVRSFTNALLVQGGHAPIEEAAPPLPKVVPNRKSWQQEARRREAVATREMVAVAGLPMKDGGSNAS